jgi:hypothetical protein
MSARRCPGCAVYYPDFPEHKKCGVCGRVTTLYRKRGPEPDWKERAAEAYYKRHDEAREGPTPEELGAAEAKEIIALEQGMTK